MLLIDDLDMNGQYEFMSVSSYSCDQPFTPLKILRHHMFIASGRWRRARRFSYAGLMKKVKYIIS